MSIIKFAGYDIELLPDKLLWMPELKLLCASDLHLEKGTYFSKFATLLPPYDTHDTLERLATALDLLKPEIFISLGDSFHDAKAGTRMDDKLKNQLNGLIAKAQRWIWVIGNHDPEIDPEINGERHAELQLDKLCFRHILKSDQDGFEISGHFHPKTSFRLYGSHIRGPCFVQSSKRLIIPSFGSYTGGLLVNSPDFTESLPDPIDKVFLVYQDLVHLVKK
jgi:DNA ligase-associated metallophosphoesterase